MTSPKSNHIDTTTKQKTVIQGTADTNTAKLSKGEIADTLDFCLNAFQPTDPTVRNAVLEKVDGSNKSDDSKEQLSDNELKVLKSIRARQMLRTEDTINIDNFSVDAIDGMVPVLNRGALGLVKREDEVVLKKPMIDLFALHKNEESTEVEAY